MDPHLGIALILGLPWCDVSEAQFTFTTTTNIPIGQDVPGGATTATLRVPTANPNTRIDHDDGSLQFFSDMRQRSMHWP